MELAWNGTVGIALGFGCGLCVGWLLKKQSKLAILANASGKLMESTVGTSGETKLVLVVRNDLKMGKGKIAAQCAHAAVIAYDQMSRSDRKTLEQWRNSGQPKIVTKAESQQQIVEIAQHARSLGLNASVVKDAGRTQIAPGSLTVVGIGPGPVGLVDQVTGHLKLM